MSPTPQHRRLSPLRKEQWAASKGNSPNADHESRIPRSSSPTTQTLVTRLSGIRIGSTSPVREAYTYLPPPRSPERAYFRARNSPSPRRRSQMRSGKKMKKCARGRSRQVHGCTLRHLSPQWPRNSRCRGPQTKTIHPLIRILRRMLGLRRKSPHNGKLRMLSEVIKETNPEPSRRHSEEIVPLEILPTIMPTDTYSPEIFPTTESDTSGPEYSLEKNDPLGSECCIENTDSWIDDVQCSVQDDNGQEVEISLRRLAANLPLAETEAPPEAQPEERPDEELDEEMDRLPPFISVEDSAFEFDSAIDTESPEGPQASLDEDYEDFQESLYSSSLSSASYCAPKDDGKSDDFFKLLCFRNNSIEPGGVKMRPDAAFCDGYEAGFAHAKMQTETLRKKTAKELAFLRWGPGNIAESSCNPACGPPGFWSSAKS